MKIGRHHIKIVHVFKVTLREFLGQFFGRDAQTVGPGNNFIIDIGNILHAFDIVAPVFQVTPYDIEDDVAHSVAHVRIVIRGNAADVHRHHVAIRHEFLFFTGERVKYLHLNSSSV